MRTLTMQQVGAVLLVLILASIGAALAEEQWRPIKSAEAGFAVELPGTPTIKRGKTKNGFKFLDYNLSIKIGDIEESYRVMFQIMGRVADTKLQALLFKNVRQSLLAKKQYSLVSEKKISLGKAAGRELKFHILVEKTVVALTVRMYVTGNRFYQVLYAAGKGMQRQEAMTRFYKSFRLL